MQSGKFRVEPVRNGALVIVIFQQVSTHHWAQYKCQYTGYEHGAGKRQRELAEEDAGKSSQESDGQVDSDQGQSHRHNR